MSKMIKKLPKKIGDDSSTKCVIIFVNGLGGGRNTWLELSNFLLQHWDKEFTFDLKYFHPYNDNTFFHKISEFLNLYRYIIGRYILFIYRVIIGESIEILAKGLKSYIEMNCYQHEKIILVGHSMGGLISRKFIVDELIKSHSVKVDKLITYATPNLGSEFAAYLGITNQIRQMNCFNSSFLIELNEDWYNLSAQLHVNPSYVVATKDPIVSHLSASGVDQNPHVVYAIGQSHSSVIHPRRVDDTSYATLVKSIETVFIESELSSTGAIEDFEIGDIDNDDNDEISGLPYN